MPESRRNMETVFSNLHRISLKLAQKTDGSWILWLHKFHCDPGVGFLLLCGAGVSQGRPDWKTEKEKIAEINKQKTTHRGRLETFSTPELHPAKGAGSDTPPPSLRIQERWVLPMLTTHKNWGFSLAARPLGRHGTPPGPSVPPLINSQLSCNDWHGSEQSITGRHETPGTSAAPFLTPRIYDSSTQTAAVPHCL